MIILLLSTFMTSLISGLFAMAGGVILMGVYSALLPVSIAMILHGVAQAFSNGFRTWFFRNDIHWPLFWRYVFGSVVALAICFWISYIPSKDVVFLLLGSVAVISVCIQLPKTMNIEKPQTAVACGVSVTFMQIFSGVSGPLLDLFYLNTNMNRYQIIANKSMTQTFGHLLKLAYYGVFLWTSLEEGFTLSYWILPGIVLMAFLGARFGKYLMHYITDMQFQKITRGLIFCLGVIYLYQGIIEVGDVDKLFDSIQAALTNTSP